jgi:glycosyltransferase involved in cell wall biosynthesis
MADRSYLMVLPVVAYRVDGGHFATEGAFADHLRLLRAKLGPEVSELVMAAPTMNVEDYTRIRSQLAVIDEAAEGIRFAPMFPNSLGRLAYLRRLPGILRRLRGEVRGAAVVHAGPSQLYRPFEIAALLMAAALGKKTISVTDIDERRSAEMKHKAGIWNARQYRATNWLHDPYQHFQQSLLVRVCSLVLLKGQKLASDYGGGRPHVRNFLDAAYSADHIIPADRLGKKLTDLADPNKPVKIAYVGRLVDYKGVDHMLLALDHAKGLGLANFHFHIIGSGEAEARLKQLMDELDLGQNVTFHGHIPFGEPLFAAMLDFHILLAAPLSEDTPRSALDAMASGQAVLAYDTYYYRELKDAGGGVDTVPWLDPQSLGRRLIEVCADRSRIAHLIANGAEFAKGNTQEIWLDRRIQWTRELMESRQEPPQRLGAKSEPFIHGPQG